uniref:asparagine synthase (glutamine-hydrolyzing) n=1 Tax=uncultured delta proteobacterium TaxID=34034 RepID=H5SJF5_9DELT|nr:asparagine synthase, glutamine-hydrolyzing [uncultured delta proteobacterium]
MCGIAGVVLQGGASIDRATLQEMTDRLAHRGPDAQGLWLAPGVGLGHRRLSILDLSEAAAQPMIARNGRSALTFNGEIYNFATLREQLTAFGEQFVSSGDTEVLLHALERWGTEALSRIHGMFAFGYWDHDNRTLLLARDRFGKKPLYYAPFGPDGIEGLAFASELRALMAHPRVRAERALDPIALVQFLVHECVPAPRSILANVRKLLPGEMLIWRDGTGLSVQSYYTPRYHRNTTGDPESLARELISRVQQATRDRLVADVPVGVFLSGGLDSSFVAACAVRAHPRVKTFSIGFDDPSFDESAHARAVAQHLGTEHVEERLSLQTMLDLVPSTLDWMDEPLADSSFIPTTLLARVARREVTVALGGDGGDEILSGYPTFVVDRALRWLPALPSTMAAAARWCAELIPPSDANFSLGFKLRQFAQGLDAHGARRHAQWLAALIPNDIGKLIGPAIPRDAVTHAFEAVDRAANGTSNDFDAATAFYLRVYLSEGVLTKVDRATMRVSLEARAPLLDTRVVEFCLGLDPSMRVRGRTTKWLMRKALASMVPAEIIQRPKKGFGAPVGAWLRGPLRPLLQETLSTFRLRDAGWFRPESVHAMIEAHVSGRADLRKPLYALLVLEHWRQRWFT